MGIIDDYTNNKMESTLIKYNKNMPEPLSDDVLDTVLRVFYRNSLKGIGENTKLDICNANLKKFRDALYDRYYNSDDINVNVVDVSDKRLLNDVVVTDIKVYATMRYDFFVKRKLGQRGLEDVDKNKILVNRARIRALMLSMLDSGRKYIPILVDEVANHKYEIDDGQGRFETCKALGIPVLFIIQEGGMTTKDVINVNKADEKPTAEEMVKMKAEDGRRPYQLLYSLMCNYKYLNLNSIGYTIRGVDITSADVFEDKFILTDELYKSKINDLIWVNSICEYMESITKNGGKLAVAPERLSYALAIYTNFKDIVNIDTDRLKEQIKKYFVDKSDRKKVIQEMVGKKSQPSVYMEVLDYIYNYRRKDEEKVIIFEKYLEYKRTHKCK